MTGSAYAAGSVLESRRDGSVRFSCSAGSIARREPLVPQAPTASGWVLLEHPGPWGPHAAAESQLLPATLRAAVRERNLRLNLVRRHRDRPRPNGTPRLCFLSSSAGTTPFVEQLQVSDVNELLTHALDAVAAGRPSGLGTRLTRPLYLVCTHGRKDVCCARFGRSVAHSVTDIVGVRAWETTHVGGCRFAANLICLPAGVYYGRVTPAEVATLVTATEEGRIALPWYRGRSGTAAGAQVAEALLRRVTGLDAVDAVRLVSAGAQPAGALYRVDMTTDWGRYRVTLRPQIRCQARLTCVDQPGEAVVTYQVAWVTKVS